MAVLDVLPWPNPFLRKKAQPVEVFDEALAQVILDMEETMADQNGLGLAATQVGIDQRLLILDPQAFRDEVPPGTPNVVIINPKLVWQSDETITGEEGCLSFPGVYIQVKRPAKVRIEAYNGQGERFEIEGEGLGARAILHEIDHLEGVVMVDHISHFSRKRALKKHQRNQAAAQPEPETAAKKAPGRAKRRRR